MLRVGSTFSGVGGADLGLERAGFQLAWTCEWDEWKRSILAAHWPDVPHYCDVRDLTNPAPVDVLCGGFPCQDLSVAGKRRGFDGERSVLAFEFLRIAESLRPRWLLMENVPGLLSSNCGRDLARLLDELGAIGYGWAYRILDARYFGVPQRRRRVFIVARRADADVDSRAAAGLALRAVWEGSGGDSTPGWPPREIVAASVGSGAASGCGHDDVSPTLVRSLGRAPTGSTQDSITLAGISATVTRKWAKGSGGPSGDECQNLVAQPVASTLTRGGHPNSNAPGRRKEDDTNLVAYPMHGCMIGRKDENGPSGTGFGSADGPSYTLTKFDTHGVVETASTLQASAGKGAGWRIDAEGAAGGHLVPEQMSVRRLTPVECERLMGWPDNWTAPLGVKAPDSKRYAACGDGIVSWVAYWIGCRIRMIEENA